MLLSKGNLISIAFRWNSNGFQQNFLCSYPYLTFFCSIFKYCSVSYSNDAWPTYVGNILLSRTNTIILPWTRFCSAFCNAVFVSTSIDSYLYRLFLSYYCNCHINNVCGSIHCFQFVEPLVMICIKSSLFLAFNPGLSIHGHLTWVFLRLFFTFCSLIYVAILHPSLYDSCPQFFPFCSLLSNRPSLPVFCARNRFFEICLSTASWLLIFPFYSLATISYPVFVALFFSICLLRSLSSQVFIAFN